MIPKAFVKFPVSGSRTSLTFYVILIRTSYAENIHDSKLYIYE